MLQFTPSHYLHGLQIHTHYIWSTIDAGVAWLWWWRLFKTVAFMLETVAEEQKKSTQKQ